MLCHRIYNSKILIDTYYLILHISLICAFYISLHEKNQVKYQPAKKSVIFGLDIRFVHYHDLFFTKLKKHFNFGIQTLLTLHIFHMKCRNT